MQKDILFDNIYIGHSVEDAATLRKETWDVKRAAEDVEDAASQPKPEDKPTSPMDLIFKDDPVKYVKEKLDLFITIAKKDPVEAIRFLPEVAGGIGVAVVTLLALLISVIGFGASSSAAPSKEDVKKAADKAKEKAVEVKDQVVDAASSGVDTAKAEVSKRTTRSSGAAE
jgi:calnexin